MPYYQDDEDKKKKDDDNSIEVTPSLDPNDEDVDSAVVKAKPSNQNDIIKQNALRQMAGMPGDEISQDLTKEDLQNAGQHVGQGISGLIQKSKQQGVQDYNEFISKLDPRAQEMFKNTPDEHKATLAAMMGAGTGFAAGPLSKVAANTQVAKNIGAAAGEDFRSVVHKLLQNEKSAAGSTISEQLGLSPRDTANALIEHTQRKGIELQQLNPKQFQEFANTQGLKQSPMGVWVPEEKKIVMPGIEYFKDPNVFNTYLPHELKHASEYANLPAKRLNQLSNYLESSINKKQELANLGILSDNPKHWQNAFNQALESGDKERAAQLAYAIKHGHFADQTARNFETDIPLNFLAGQSELSEPEFKFIRSLNPDLPAIKKYNK